MVINNNYDAKVFYGDGFHIIGRTRVIFHLGISESQMDKKSLFSHKVLDNYILRLSHLISEDGWMVLYTTDHIILF